MRLLPDTNILIWWLEESSRLGKETRDVITGEPEVMVSAVRAFEIAAKVAFGKLRAPGDLAVQIAEQTMIELPVTVRHGLAVGQLPMHHRDLFDWLLIAPWVSWPDAMGLVVLAPGSQARQIVPEIVQGGA